MRLAPEIPSTETLQAMHPLSDEGRQKVHDKRREVADALKFGRTLLAIIGPCAMTDDAEALLDENRQIVEFADKNNLTILHRMPPWKPRTNPDDWHGLETANPEEAHRITVAIAEQSGNLAMEFGHPSHIGRYMAQAALGWRGSRNDKEADLLAEIIDTDSTMPVALKNGMAGSLEPAHNEALSVFWKRGQRDAAPVIPIFRGGQELQNPTVWTHEYIDAFHPTKGRFIVDVAHGSEQAYDPRGEFTKSALGQIACLEDVIMMADVMDLIPRGVMIESSNVPSPTDPVVPLEETFEILQKLAAIKHESQRFADLRTENLRRRNRV